jgi:hypothetical protein
MDESTSAADENSNVFDASLRLHLKDEFFEGYGRVWQGFSAFFCRNQA